MTKSLFFIELNFYVAAFLLTEEEKIMGLIESFQVSFLYPSGNELIKTVFSSYVAVAVFVVRIRKWPSWLKLLEVQSFSQSVDCFSRKKFARFGYSQLILNGIFYPFSYFNRSYVQFFENFDQTIEFESIIFHSLQSKYPNKWAKNSGIPHGDDNWNWNFIFRFGFIFFIFLFFFFLIQIDFRLESTFKVVKPRSNQQR